jgi:DNA sulfur modification protein DndB
VYDTPKPLLNLKECETLEEAQKLAGIEAANTGALPMPVVIFRQGERINATGAMPMSWVRNLLEPRPASRQGSLRDTQTAWNRPEDSNHSKEIGKYLSENYDKRYIIPPLTLNIQHKINLYQVPYQGALTPGYVVIPATAKLAITDGQHRRSGIITALEELTDKNEEAADEFARHAIAVMITCETDLDQIHQDFADCSKTKALPRSLLAVYDRRNPANRLVTDLERECPLFRGRIDSTSKTLSKKSTFLFLANQLRQLVKELLTGSYGTTDADFEKVAMHLLATDQQYHEVLQTYATYINHLSKVIKVWEEIANIPSGTLEVSQIPIKREEGWICLTATGLNLIGRVGHAMFVRGEQNWQQYADELGAIDWRRSAPIWQNHIIQGNRILNQQGPLRRAFNEVCNVIELHIERKR